jgi:two-component system, LuxR family, response regulator FixJ
MTTGSAVHVIDDDEAARESLTFLLKTAHLAVRAYASAKEFLDALPSIEDGCIVTDMKMPEIDGLELIRRLKSHRTSLPVIAITGHGDVALAVEAMKAGAVNFIEKPYESETVLGAVRSALNAHAMDAKRDSERAEIRERLVALSPRERQVLDGLVAGQPNKAIADDLGISSHTVEICRANVFAKMRATNLSQLVRMVLIATRNRSGS